MKKVTMIFALLAATVVTVNAQTGHKSSESKKFTFAIGPVVSFPTGDFGTVYNVGFGAEAEGSVGIADKFEGFLQAGYSSFSVKSAYGSGNTGFIPVLVGARYNAGGFIGGLGLGYGSFTGGGSSSGGFAFSPQAGYNFGKIEALANYTSTSTSGSSLGFFGVKVFFKF